MAAAASGDAVAASVAVVVLAAAHHHRQEAALLGGRHHQPRAVAVALGAVDAGHALHRLWTRRITRLIRNLQASRGPVYNTTLASQAARRWRRATAQILAFCGSYAVSTASSYF